MNIAFPALAFAASLITASTASAIETDATMQVDCARPYAQSVPEVLAREGRRFRAEDGELLESMLASLRIEPLPALTAPEAHAVFETLAVLIADNTAIAAEIVHLNALEMLPAWRGTVQATLFTRLLERIYLPYHPDEAEGGDAGHDEAGHDEADDEFNNALVKARDQVLGAMQRLPGFLDRPVRWQIQGVVYDDPRAREVAAAQLCGNPALAPRVPAINVEIGKIVEAAHSR